MGRGRAVVTNTVSPLAATLLGAAGLSDCFECVACANLVPRSKPAPDLVLYALEKLGVAAGEALMVGDSRYDRERLTRAPRTSRSSQPLEICSAVNASGAASAGRSGAEPVEAECQYTARRTFSSARASSWSDIQSGIMDVRP
jgi:hypothetical protein